MQNVYDVSEFDGVDGTEGITIMVGADFQNLGAAEALHRFGIDGFFSDLGEVEGVAKVISDILVEILQIFKAGADEEEILRYFLVP
jgi:hypothetical protein